MTRTKRTRTCWLAAATAAVAFATGPTIAADTPEVEPNESKATATVVGAGMVTGDTLSGSSTGSVTTPGGNSVDYFRVKTAPAALGIYRHRLQLGATANGSTMRGLNQTDPDGTSGGLIGTTDSIIQTSGATAVPRIVQWYGFGKEEQIYFRVTGVATSTPYTATLTTDTVTATDVGAFNAGTIVITTIGQGHTTDTDLWVYDENFNAIPTFGNDDESVAGGGTGLTLQSRLTRTYAPGRYYLALSNFQFANNQASSEDDDFETGVVLDFADAAANSSTTTNVNVTFSIIDSAETLQVPATRADAFGVVWFTFLVEVPPPFGACCFDNGTCLDNQSSADCTTAGGTYGGDGSDCTPNACPQPGACCVADVCSQHTAATCAGLGGTFRGVGSSCTPNPCVGACCQTDGSCSELTSAACGGAGGTYRGDGTDCSPNPCVGGCCLPDATCSVLTSAACASATGAYRGDGTDCTGVDCTGACCLPDDTCIPGSSPNSCATAGGLFRGAGSGCTGCDVTDEAEPNDVKAQATDTGPIAGGHRLLGSTTGSSTTVPGNGSADFFKVTTATAPLGIYRQRLTRTSAAAHGGAIMGLPQAGTASNTTVCQSHSGVTAPFFSQWYGFGKGEMIYYRVTGVATSTAPYEYTFSRTSVTPVDVGNFNPGAFAITTGTRTTIDTEMYLYDAAFNLVEQNDDPPTPSAAFQSEITRSLTPGRYYVAVSTFDTQTSTANLAPDDRSISGSRLDFPDALTRASSSTTSTDLDFGISVDAGPFTEVTASVAGSYDVYWATFLVGTPCPGVQGDADCSGAVDFFDIDPFLLSLFDLNAYQTTGCGGGPCCGGSICTVDVNCSGAIDFFDIDPFLACLFGACVPCP